MKPIKPVATAARVNNETGVIVDLPYGYHTTTISVGTYCIQLKSIMIRANDDFPVHLLPKEVRVETVNTKTGKKMFKISFIGNATDEKTKLLIKYIGQVSHFNKTLQLHRKSAWTRTEINTVEWIMPEACIEKTMLDRFRPKAEKPVEEPKVEEPVEEFNGDETDHVNYGC